VDLVLWEIELFEVCMHRLRREALVSELRDRGVPVPLRELLPILAEEEPVVNHLGQLTAYRTRDPLLHLEVRPVIVPADDVGDPIEIVCDGAS
jgi:hypothetical protein